MRIDPHYDVVIMGAGLAGLSLARQLSLISDKRVLLIDKRAQLPPKRQKVGESLVQLAGYYFSKVLDLEEHLLSAHFMKYNLRFYWKSDGQTNRCFEDYSQGYIRSFSNIASYQLDRNTFEAELIRLNQEAPDVTLCNPISDLHVTLSDSAPHDLSYRFRDRRLTVKADWVVDTTGRQRLLRRQLVMAEKNNISHGASFCWVEGLVDISKLTERTMSDKRLHRNHTAIGHLPIWLATNHFMGEGFWFWVIPLQGKTSLGVVYDRAVFPREQVSSPEKLIEWVCQEFPLFARDLPNRNILDHGSYKDFSYGCTQTINPTRWALSGESGRFADPLYSPGSDFIAVHNTLIADAILTTDFVALKAKCLRYDLLMRSLYESLIPAFSVSYNALGDQEAFILKYSWELSVYFAFFVFPFVNDLLTKRQFLLSFLGKFSRLGAINKTLQGFISDYYMWKKTRRVWHDKPLFHDFTHLEPLQKAEQTFYCVGESVKGSIAVLDKQLENLNELARYIVAYIYSVVLDDQSALTNRFLIDSLDLHNLHFNPKEMAAHYSRCGHAGAPYAWSFDPFVLDQFRNPVRGESDSFANASQRQ